MSANPAPPLGDEYPDVVRACTRMVGRNDDGSEILCLRPAAVHVDWGDATGYICQIHMGDLHRWSIHAGHELGAACGMPGSLWFDASWEGESKSWCAIPDDNHGAAVTEPELVEAVAFREGRADV